MTMKMAGTRGRAPARRIAAATFALVIGAGALAAAIEKGPLPPFQVVGLDGTAVESAQAGPAGHWLLIYMTPASAASARLLGAMKQWESSDLDARTVVIIGAAVDKAARFAEQHAADYPAIRWFADPDGSAWRALRLTGTPYILGIKDGQIVWSLAGVLNDPKALESVIRSWVEPKTL
jgi:hypothetical protein